MQRICLLILSCCLSLSLWSAAPVRYRLSGNVGSMMHGSIIDPWLGNRPITGGEFAVEFLPTGKWESLQWYNNASVGLALNYLNLTNKDYLGHAIAPYAYLNIPLVNTKHFILGLRPGIGMSFVTKTYANTVPEEMAWVSGFIKYPYANGAIGSHTNAYFAEALYMEFPITKGFSITASYGWYHISNGSTKQPNSGYNMFNGAIGLTYFPDHSTYQAPPTQVPHNLYEGKRWDVELSISGGLRQAYYVDQRFNLAGAVSLAVHYRPWSIFKIGGGLDMFVDMYYASVCDEFHVADPAKPGDRSETYYAKTYLAAQDYANCFRVGVSIQPEFVLGNFSAGLHFGVYLYDPVKNLEPYSEVAANGGKPLNRGIFYKYDLLNAGVKQDGWLYTRLLLKYRCTDHFFVLWGMKSHVTKVEFFDFGVGVCL